MNPLSFSTTMKVRYMRIQEQPWAKKGTGAGRTSHPPTVALSDAVRRPKTPTTVPTLQRTLGNQVTSHVLTQDEHVHGASCGHAAAYAGGAQTGPPVTAQRAVAQNAAKAARPDTTVQRAAARRATVQRLVVQRASYEDMDLDDPYQTRGRSGSRSGSRYASSSGGHERSSSSGPRSWFSAASGSGGGQRSSGRDRRHPPVAGDRYADLFAAEDRGRSRQRPEDVDMDAYTPSRASSRRSSRARSGSRGGDAMEVQETGRYERRRSSSHADRAGNPTFYDMARDIREQTPLRPDHRDVGFRYAPQPVTADGRSTRRRSSSRRQSRSRAVEIPPLWERLTNVGNQVLNKTKQKMKYGAANQAPALNAHGGASTARLMGARSVPRKPASTRQEFYGQSAAAAEAAGTGNCQEHADMVFCLLNRMKSKLPSGLTIWHVSLSTDHVFCAIGRADDPMNIVIVDPWQNNAVAKHVSQWTWFPFLIHDQYGGVRVTPEATPYPLDGRDYLDFGRRTIDTERLEANRDLPDDAFMVIDGVADQTGAIQPLHIWNHGMPPAPRHPGQVDSRMRRELRRQRASSHLGRRSGSQNPSSTRRSFGFR
jgi:hypothetical protein